MWRLSWCRIIAISNINQSTWIFTYPAGKNINLLESMNLANGLSSHWIFIMITNQKWFDLGSVALFLSFSLFIFLFFLILAPRSEVFEPPPPLSSPTFCFTSPSSDLGLYEWDLLEALGDSSLQRTLSLLSARLFLSSGCQDLLRPWMFGEHRIWGFLPV